MKKLYHYTPMLILSLITAFILMIFEISAFISQTLFKPQIYSDTMGKGSISQTIYDELDEYFKQYSAPTGIPHEVFTKSLDKKKLSNAAYALLTDSLSYLTNPDAPKPQVTYDFTQLESDITEYIENYSEQNEIEKDEEYYSLIDSTITTAKEQIENKLDIMMLYTLSQTGFASKLHKYAGMVNIGMTASAILLAVLLSLMVFIDRHHPRDFPYWTGSIMFCSSAVILVPAIYLKKTRFFDGFFMRSEHIYRTVTGLFSEILDKIIFSQTIILAIGVFLIILTLVIHKLYRNYCKKRHFADD